MAKNFAALINKMPAPRQARIKAKANALLKGMALNELREALNLTQEELATTLKVKQAEISKLEHRSDIYLSTLRRIIEAMGGTLEIVARMPDGPVTIQMFRKVRSSRGVRTS